MGPHSISIDTIDLLFEAIKVKLDSIRQEEIEFHKNKLGSEDLEKIEGITSRLMNKLARQMINHLKENHKTEIDPVETVSSILELQK